MMRILSTLLAAALLATAGLQPAGAAPPPEATPLTFQASDGVTVHARYYPAATPKALILLFHQAGSSKDEYATIAPRLAAAGYSALAVDQRSGGSLFGVNETAAGLGRDPGYLAAKQDLEGALRWGEAQHQPLVLWGSSYSAALVFLVAAEHPGAVRAVLAFSPGEYLNPSDAVRRASAQLRAPVFVTSAQDAGEIAAARAILAASPAQVKVQYVPSQGGVHGSSTLIAARNPGGAEANWQAALAFLKAALG
ncbi:MULTISPECIES: alpha/beta hydrolase [Inquilinus]|uniref:Dienelactone hydrolase n=1 Tax=Inquilinus ginsengisoli TaxID=363840 RepID=A0ABU1K174_9PROT|nr:alpha/beta hydrolase [Inquilinus ginsengisoli]MDR6294621.1 dienelactone hydrolase [Inquilinus ginsengisoli]